jgi:hypothetical protein
MDNNISALQNLYVAMGGDIEDVENITINPDMINAIAGLMSVIAPTLEPFVITLTATSASAGTSDKTAAEIMEAFEAGRKVIVNGSFDGADQTLYPIAVSRKDGRIAICAIGIQEPTGVMLEALMPWSDDDDNAWELKPYLLTPAT